jgi:hypothetical protein
MSAVNEIPDWLLERLAAGELPSGQADELRKRLRQSGREQRLDEIRRSNEAILSAHAPQAVTTEIRRRLAIAGRPLSAQRPRRLSAQRLRPLWALSMATACVAGLAMLWAVRDHRGSIVTGPAQQADEERTKGDVKPELLVYRKTAAGSEQLHGYAVVRRGDTLQIRYVAAGRLFGIIASTDSRSHITFHLPEASGPAAQLLRDGERALPHAYELDDSPGFERFVFVTAEAPFDSNDILPLLKNGSPLPARFSWYELALKKETP